jgi:hypothetical protein
VAEVYGVCKTALVLLTVIAGHPVPAKQALPVPGIDIPALEGTYTNGPGLTVDSVTLAASKQFTYRESGCLGEYANIAGTYRLHDGWLCLQHPKLTKSADRQRLPRHLLPVPWRGNVYLLRPADLFLFALQVHARKEPEPSGMPSTFLHRTVGIKALGGADGCLPDMPEPWLSVCRNGPPTGHVIYKETDGHMAVDLGARHGLVRGMKLTANSEKPDREDLIVVSVGPLVCRVKTARPIARRVEVGEPVSIGYLQLGTQDDQVPCPYRVEKTVQTNERRAIEAALLEVARGDKIVVDSKGLEDFHPSDPRIVVGDLRLITAEFERLTFGEPEYSVNRFDLNYSTETTALSNLFPGCNQYVWVESVSIGPTDRAVVDVRVGPGAHGLGYGSIVLRKRSGRWIVAENNLRWPQ